MRFVTALVLMGLLLGAGGARAGLSGPALAAAESRPAATQSTTAAKSTVDGLRAPLALGGSSRTTRHESSGVAGESSGLAGESSGVAGEGPVAVAEQPSATLVSALPSEEKPVAAGSVGSTVLVPVALFGGQPDRPVVGAAVGGWPAGNAYARVAGPRAPPLG
ncbi:hypothetical protein [Plantactinospora sp. WMMB782]|uniref:hypothetical protein n=1 Tax=Plantactinospora sp. WMMB782 TaxID=3404121 RepID=UPI003B93576E